jgi:hypothetical protein
LGARVWGAGQDWFPPSLIVISTVACPTGWTEVAAFDGLFLRGTLNGHSDVNGTGGVDTVTPAGTNGTVSFTPAGTSTNTSGGTPSGTNGTAAFTPAGTVAWPAGVPTFAGVQMSTHSHELPFQINGNTFIRAISTTTFGTGTSRAAVQQSTGVANVTSAAVALSSGVTAGTPAGTVAWPAGVPTFAGSGGTVPAETFTGVALATHTHTFNGTPGTVPAETFTGNSFDNRPAFIKVIFCRKD